MPSVTLLDLQTVLRKIGRGVVCYAVDGSGDPTRWDTSSELLLAHLGDTEGDIVFNPNDDVATLTLPEISGGATYEATAVGENPEITIPLFMADPDLLPIVSPTNSAGGGFTRVRDVAERTLVIFPEELFRDESTDPATYETLAHAGGSWTLGGEALTAAQQVIMGNAVWLWRVYFTRPTRSFLGGHGDDGKNIVECTARAMMHPDMPEGHRLYTQGDPDDYSIDIDGGS